VQKRLSKRSWRQDLGSHKESTFPRTLRQPDQDADPKLLGRQSFLSPEVLQVLTEIQDSQLLKLLVRRTNL
jgi:hypothetical protein